MRTSFFPLEMYKAFVSGFDISYFTPKVTLISRFLCIVAVKRFSEIWLMHLHLILKGELRQQIATNSSLRNFVTSKAFGFLCFSKMSKLICGLGIPFSRLELFFDGLVLK